MKDTHVSRRSFLKSAALAAVAIPTIGMMSACSPQGTSSANESSTNDSAAEQPSPSNATAASASSAAAPIGSSVLVAYYSASGNTARVANEIAAQLGADTFAIEPAEPYTADDLNWRAEGSRVNREHDDESLRDVPLVQATPDDFASYDTVFIGYPIWWAIAAWPVDGFVEGNDFEGKTVIPFCTSTSSGIGSSATQLEALANGGTWLEGQRFASSADQGTVTAWLEALGQD